MYQKDFSMEQAMEFANSPAGRKLMDILLKKKDPKLEQAARSAVSGNTDKARQDLADILKDPEIIALLKQFGG